MKIFIKDNVSNESFLHETELEWSGDFVWTEGNFACDCNRSRFFHEAKHGVWPDVLNTQCGHERYSIPYIITGSGERVIIDG